METLNIQCIEQQQVLITLTLTDSNGAPVDLTKYAVYAASVGAVDPYCRRAARLEWAAAINNECSAFIITAPGHDIARAPWKYQICVKNRQLGLEWAVVSGRVELTPRACGTDGISPAAYTVACEATPSGLVNVTLDATVGSISETLEQVKASAAAAASAAQNAHADLEDAETAATRASQAALAAASDARIASDKAAAAEAAATAAPEACAPYVQQVQQAAAQALDASRAATTAAASAQASADAAAPAQGYATRAEEAKTAAVQAAETATTAATTATQQAESATAQAESARLAATTASTAADNAQAAATRAEDAATRAEAARDAAEAAAATATTAAVDVPGLVTRAETAATASEAARTAAETAQSTAETAATTATAQAEAAAASATQADTDARACAIYDQRVSANATRAEAAQQAAAASETAAAASATAAAASAQELLDEELGRMVDLAAAAYGLLEMAGVKSGVEYLAYSKDGVPAMSITSGTQLRGAKILVSNNANVRTTLKNVSRVYYNEKPVEINIEGSFAINETVFIHAPYVKTLTNLFFRNGVIKVIFSDDTKFKYTTSLFYALRAFPVGAEVKFVPGTTMSSVTEASHFAEYAAGLIELPDEFTFESVKNFESGFIGCTNLKRLPAAMTLQSCTNATGLLHNTPTLEIDDIVRVCSTINDLQSLETPKTGTLGLPVKCKHNGTEVTNTQDYLKANHPDFLTTLSAKGWTVTFA